MTIRAAGTAVRMAVTTCLVSASPHSATTAACAAVAGEASTWASAVGTALIMLPHHGPDVSASRFGTISMLRWLSTRSFRASTRWPARRVTRAGM